MHSIWRDESASHLAMYRIETTVLAHVVSDLAGRVALPHRESADPLEELLWGLGDDELDDDERDPILDRLFPQVFPHDERASAEHRRYSEPDLRRQKEAEADVVLDALGAARRVAFPVPDAEPDEETVHEVVVPDAELDPWLRTLTACRLQLAGSLDITSAEDMEGLEAETDEGRRYEYSVYEFLGELQAVLLGMKGYE